ncbi:alpha/beta fold hydrolase [Mycolicibacterium sp.]|uniref:alpha/beta fold hydrolase n=1 Tax=Mycolicibacterium sp. TaxID=2320850 RepID=UPI0037C5C574
MTFTPPLTGTVEYNRAGTTLSHRVRPGTGTPLVVAPGVMADAATWQPVADAIELPNPVVTLNRRGRSPSGALGADYSVGVEIADLRHILEQLGPVHLFGWSYGALVALETALDTTHLRSVIAYEPVSRPFAPNVIPQLGLAITAGDLDQAVTLVNTEVSGFSDAYVAELRRSPAWPALRSLAVPLADELAAVNSHQPEFGGYRHIDVPVTLVLGALNQDRAPYGTAFAPFADALPQANIVRLPGQGHLAHVEAPADLARAITAAVKAAESS